MSTSQPGSDGTSQEAATKLIKELKRQLLEAHDNAGGDVELEIKNWHLRRELESHQLEASYDMRKAASESNELKEQLAAKEDELATLRAQLTAKEAEAAINSNAQRLADNRALHDFMMASNREMENVDIALASVRSALSSAKEVNNSGLQKMIATRAKSNEKKPYHRVAGLAREADHSKPSQVQQEQGEKVESSITSRKHSVSTPEMETALPNEKEHQESERALMPESEIGKAGLRHQELEGQYEGLEQKYNELQRIHANVAEENGALNKMIGGTLEAFIPKAEKMLHKGIKMDKNTRDLLNSLIKVVRDGLRQG